MLECDSVLRPSALPMGALYRIKNYIWIKKWLTAIVSLKAAPWAVFPEKMKATYTAHISQIAAKNLTLAPENAWALHPRPLASFLNLGGCTSELNVPL